jgi:SAM-dependent methyltransferase
MKEASKTKEIRAKDFEQRYLQGRVLDIGAGTDPVCATAVVFDQQHGDANHIDRYYGPETFDTVHSSHCLEHMQNPVAALSAWWTLVKPGGYMVIVVPDEELYEQGIWPSFFNRGHISTFRLNKADGITPVSYDIAELCKALPKAQVISAKIQDAGFNRELIFPSGQRPRRLRHPVKLAASIVKRIADFEAPIRVTFNKWLVRHGYPVDQTLGRALAQIEVIIKKER